MKVASMHAIGVRGVVLVVLLVLGCTLAPGAARAVPADAARATYNDAGRLRSFTTTDATADPRAQREASIFSWDAVGNLLSVDRFLASELSVIGMTPERGQVGDTVAIDGTGFGTDPRALVVRFAGTSATVVSASDEQLRVQVPSGASTGTVSVTLGRSIATSADSFTVVSDQAPTISSVTPTIADAGDALTVSGAHFAASKGENDVRVNSARALVSSARASEIVAEAPPTGSGHLSVATPDGVVTGPDVFIAPSGYSAADVEDTGRLTLGSGASISLSAVGKRGLYVVDLRANDRLSIQLSGSTMSGGVTVWSPTGANLASESFSSGSQTTSALQVATSGTYAILVSATAAGGVTLTPFVDTVEEIVPTATGDTRTVRTSFAGQDARLRFSGRAGQRIAVAVDSNTLSGWVELAPAGTRSWFGSYSGLSSSAWLDVITLPSDGVYNVWLETYGSSGGEATVTAYDVPADMSEDVTLTSSPLRREIEFDNPAQNQIYVFDGRAGERVELRFPEIDLSAFMSRVIDESGSTVASASWTSSSDGFMEATLPDDGRYRIVVDPTDASTGSVTMEAVEASDVVESITPSSSGVTRTLTTTYAGQDVRLRFEAREGQRIAVGVGSNTLEGYIEVARAGTTSYLPTGRGCRAAAVGSTSTRSPRTAPTTCGWRPREAVAGERPSPSMTSRRRRRRT